VGHFDLHLPMMSAARIFEANANHLPTRTLFAARRHTGIDLATRCPAGTRKIGLVWSGNPGNVTIDRVRSMRSRTQHPCCK